MTKIDSKRAVDYGKREQAGKRPRARVSLFPFPSYLAHFRFSSSPSQHPTTLSDDSKNVTFKMNKRFFKLCRVYSNSLKMSNVGKLPWSLFLEDRTQG